MKAIKLAFVALFVLFTTNCSDFEQSNSPIFPDTIQKPIVENDFQGAYQYLQCFQFIPVESINNTKSINSIEIVISPNKFPKYFIHMYILVEYHDYSSPLEDELIFVGKPPTNVIQLNDISVKNITSVKVYAYVPDADGKGICPPFDYLTSFKELDVEYWNVQPNEIQIVTEDWKSNLTDSFVQLELLRPDYDSPAYVLTYISRPDCGKIVLPKFLKESIKDVKIFGHFSEVAAETF